MKTSRYIPCPSCHRMMDAPGCNFGWTLELRAAHPEWRECYGCAVRRSQGTNPSVPVVVTR